MSPKTNDAHTCKCSPSCRNCANRDNAALKSDEPSGFLASRPWIWLLVGYLFMIGALGTMVMIAVNHPQQDIQLQHEH